MLAGAEWGEVELEWENILYSYEVHFPLPTTLTKLQSPSLLSISTSSSSSFPLPPLLSFKVAPPFFLEVDLLFRAVISLKRSALIRAAWQRTS